MLMCLPLFGDLLHIFIINIRGNVDMTAACTSDTTRMAAIIGNYYITSIAPLIIIVNKNANNLLFQI